MTRQVVRACVIGYPLRHSLSPVIHNYWFHSYGLNGSYESLPVEAGCLEKELERLGREGYAGCNVTIPYKQDVMPLCLRLHESAQAIGAVNTLCFTSGGMEGRNTDAFGYAENLRSHIPGLDWCNLNVFILGAGGAARAVVHAFREQGAKRIVIANRSRARAEHLARDFGCEVASWDDMDDCLSGSDILVNTTSLGMLGQPPLDIRLENLPRDAIVSDIVYAPLMTPLLKQALARGHRIVTGIGMLLHQARPAFEAWTGILPDVTPELERLVLEKAA